ncbi:MAG: hypothetical protein BGO01_03760 [Armatimonadetes bacterium 55-13]|nr:hypothetical protein [Armatimonadota bacterium]OJU63063.1 MAG: hypothetical protein BGO01_03760 [Armatimonadetes bacterium 55-13]
MTLQNTGDEFARYHDAFQDAVADYMRKRQWHVESVGYHDVLSSDAVKILKKRYNPTAQAYRTKPDLLCNHEQYDLTLNVEVKSNDGKHANWAVEMRPVVNSWFAHVVNRTDTLYVYKDLGYCHEDVPKERHRPKLAPRAAWIQELVPLVSRIIVPESCSIEERKEYRRLARTVEEWREIPVEVRPCAGSGDAMVIIPYDRVKELPRFATELEAWTQSFIDANGYDDDECEGDNG